MHSPGALYGSAFCTIHITILVVGTVGVGGILQTRTITADTRLSDADFGQSPCTETDSKFEDPHISGLHCCY